MTVDRIDGTLATVAHCVQSNIEIVRVHDVRRAFNVIGMLHNLRSLRQ